MDRFSPFQLTIESPFPHSQLSVLIYTVKSIDQNNQLLPTLTPLSHIPVHNCRTMKTSTSHTLKNDSDYWRRERRCLTANSASGSSASQQRTLQGQLQNLQRSKLAALNKCQLCGTSLVVQWIGQHTPNAGGLGSIPGQGTSSHMPQLRRPQVKIPCATSKTWHRQAGEQLDRLTDKLIHS